MMFSATRFHYLLGLAALMWASTSQGLELVTQHEWLQLKRGVQISQYPPMARIARAFEQTKDGRIVVLYPGGEAGQRWAEEIRDWFVALGIPSTDIAVEPGSGYPDVIGIQVEGQALE